MTITALVSPKNWSRANSMMIEGSARWRRRTNERGRREAKREKETKDQSETRRAKDHEYDGVDEEREGNRYCRHIHRYVRLAGRAVGQQLPKWSGKQYPCTELRAER